ncbi:RNA dependent RNA polymerase-domain-containing protein [Mycena rosella]|uniref:RNA-dependent RNA polymerase n=1 Tax=Mycena rosella TaxID=1033263 RepID=A0AAD7CWC1_MYCRO|nr:RNA dependent RNA polymerase-domain-containing protein [Mycena rosella]
MLRRAPEDRGCIHAPTVTSKNLRLQSPAQVPAAWPPHPRRAHSPAPNRIFNALGLPYGVRYELARIAATNGYEKLGKSDLETLKGLSNSKAVLLIPGLFGKSEHFAYSDEAYAKEIAAKAPWQELDLEDENLSKNNMAGLGLSEEAPDWFGGKVHFTGRLIADSRNRGTPFKLGPSDRFARRWGSGSFLTLSLGKEILNGNKGDKIMNFLCRPFILGDRVFRAFDAKVGNVFLVCTNEIVEGRRIHPTRTVPGLLSLREFLAWHNSLEVDEKQTMAKWASSDMTDGAGLINKAALRLIYNRVEMDTWPTAIQCRVLVDVDDKPRIWLRPSQTKVKHTSWEDPTLRTIDLLRSSHAKTQCRLSVETIINLAENGVPSGAFIKLVEDALVNLVTPLRTWEGEDAMEMLWCAVARTGGVMSSRLARKETVLARVKGFSERDSDDLEHDNEERDATDQPTSTAWWVDQVSGCPSSLEETVMYLLDAGFTPQTCTVLRSKLDIIVQGCVKRCIESYRIDLPVGMSAMAFIVPDETGLLEPGEFFLKSTRHDFKTRDGMTTDILLGPALVTRHPCKWTAVDRPELRHFTNVIVFSVKGPRRVADYLSGGDYDGDKCLVIWQPELVDPFEPPDLAANFKPKNETVRDFLERTADSPDRQVRGMQQYLLMPNWHINATYSLGYTHPETVRPAYMFCKTLDGAKTGLSVLPSVYAEDQNAYEKRAPWNKIDETNTYNLARPQGSAHLSWTNSTTTRSGASGVGVGERTQEEIDAKFKEAPHVVDADLTAPWIAFVEKEYRWAPRSEQDVAMRGLELIKRHVEAQNQWQIHQLPIERKQDILRELSRDLATGPPGLSMDAVRDFLYAVVATGADGLAGQDEAARIKASYAYFYDSEQAWTKWSRFPWNVAFRELCLIKCRSRKTSLKPVNSEFYERFTMKMPRI